MKVAAPLGPFTGRVGTCYLSEKINEFQLKLCREGLGSMSTIILWVSGKIRELTKLRDCRNNYTSTSLSGRGLGPIKR